MKNTEEHTEIEPDYCRICQNAENNTTHIAREMMYGLREEFEYFQCGECGCLQIAEFPEEMDAYYPQNYYSFQPKKMGPLKLLQKKKSPSTRSRRLIHLASCCEKHSQVTYCGSMNTAM